MKFAIQYVNDGTGNIKAVQLPINEWEKLLLKLHKYEQVLKVKSDLREAFRQVAELKRSKAKKTTLSEFLDEL